MKAIETVTRNAPAHWVGDGFPVRTLISPQSEAQQNSPFLLLDFAGPHQFDPTTARRGVGTHPHRGFETVTIVYDGEVSHRDSAGHEGTIGPGDVQWMTAAGGILHEEYHSDQFAASGGPFKMVQLWVDLPRAHKMDAPRYQAITKEAIPTHSLPGAHVRVIAGQVQDSRGPAQTFSPVNVWDVTLKPGTDITLPLPDGHTGFVVVLDGAVRINGDTDLDTAQTARFSQSGQDARLQASASSQVLVLTGEPLNQPVVAQGPFVMSSRQEIGEAIADLKAGRFAAA